MYQDVIDDVDEEELIDEHGEGDSKTDPLIMQAAEARVRDMLRELFQYRSHTHQAEVRACLHAIGCAPALLMDQPLQWELLTGARLYAAGGGVGRELDHMLERRAGDQVLYYLLFSLTVAENNRLNTARR